MSGHNKWSGIKHRKAAVDSKRAQSFTKHAKLITLAARDGGGNPEMNFQLRLAIDRARLDNMPKDNIERAIKKGTGELKDGTEIEEILYEGMGPGGIMMLIKTATDNRNRTVSEIKSLFTKNGGKLGEMGSAMWNFKKVGQLILNKPQVSDWEEKIIESGAEDFSVLDDGSILLYTLPENLKTVQINLASSNLPVADATIAYISMQKAEISPDERIAYEKLIEILDAHDDVQEVFDNL